MAFYARRNTPEKGEPLLRELIDFRKQHPEPKADVADEELTRALDTLGLNLLQQHKWVDAEKVLRECLDLRDKQDISIRQLSGGRVQSVGFNTRSMLGQSLVGQKRYTEAEPFLLQGYKGVKELANNWNGSSFDISTILPIKEAAERLVPVLTKPGTSPARQPDGQGTGIGEHNGTRSRITCGVDLSAVSG